MPEVKDWRKRRDARVKAAIDIKAVEVSDEMEWKDADVNVSGSAAFMLLFPDRHSGTPSYTYRNSEKLPELPL